MTMSDGARDGMNHGPVGSSGRSAMGDEASARWQSLEACRDYLRLVIRRGRWARNDRGLQSTSDLVQRTMVDGWQKLSGFRGRTPSQLRAWLKSILINASLNDRRRSRAETDGGGQLTDLCGSGTSPSRAAQRKDSKQAVDAAIDGLSERQRRVIQLRIWEQLSFAQIGEKLDVSEDAARMLFARALGTLRESMKAGHDPQ
jgi:RNA polymerase sigma-70 factor (ECF subfamily)